MSFSTTCEFDHSKNIHRKFNTLHISSRKHIDPLVTTKPFETRNHG